MGLEPFLRRAIAEGALEVALPDGRRVAVGDGGEPEVAIRLESWPWAARIAADPEVAVGDAYMAGAINVERGDVYQLLDLAGRNLATVHGRPAGPLRRWGHDWLSTRNARRQARRNVEHHYDLPLAFYRRFLDDDLQYSCAYFERPGLSLEDAQLAKQRHIEAKLLLAPEHRVLDIGCGWGGLALRLAADSGVRVDGVTLSEPQRNYARVRAEALGLAERAHFQLADFRDVPGRYDRIVSVGMFEHVGRPNYPAFFERLASLLTDDGVALLHAIGRFSGPGVTQPWLAKHIFPGGYIPALSETLAAIERSGLIVTDVEVLRLHYAETLRCWRERFAAQRREVAAQRGEAFCRMWEFYLAASEVGFRRAGHMVFQIQLAKRQESVPLTRRYIGETERRLSERLRQAA